VFRTPQALEINLPPKEDVKVDVAQSKVLEVRVLADARVYWRNAQDQWARTSVGELVNVFAPWKADKEKIVVVRIDRDAKFNNMVDIIDELDLANLTRFSLQTLNETEKKEVEAL
jgi:biopolymer transport protein ExbD